MRQQFDPQTSLKIKPIEETPVLEKSRDDAPALMKALLAIYKNVDYRKKIFDILEQVINKSTHKSGRKGLTLWQLFVLGQFRLGLNMDYDRLHYMVANDRSLRQLLGIATYEGYKEITIGYQRIIDNVRLLDDETLKRINDIVVSFGHDQVFKKKETEALRVKTDSFVVESNVHFPTDYNLLWDSARKCLDTLQWFKTAHPNMKGWRKSHDWFKAMKNLCRSVGVSNKSGGKNKSERLASAVKKYLTKATAFSQKLQDSKAQLPIETAKDLKKLNDLESFMVLMDKHIDLVNRRLLKGEKIPHEEKIFSIFEQYTQWISKGKRNPSVELGKNTCITTDQYHLIIGHYIMDQETDAEVIVKIINRLQLNYPNIASNSTDKGFYSKKNKAAISQIIPQVIMPKKGNKNQQEKAAESDLAFKKLRNQHSAVESNINELEHCGLGRCRDKGYQGFKRYVAMGVVAYNLKRIGRAMLSQELEKITKKKRKEAA